MGNFVISSRNIGWLQAYKFHGNLPGAKTLAVIAHLDKVLHSAGEETIVMVAMSNMPDLFGYFPQL